ncbi:hypothetical protein HBH46_015760 [Parastagonospora nodorum]|nr:hypothetical protein HBH46_015760 [Parastagonospora nodorum]
MHASLRKLRHTCYAERLLKLEARHSLLNLSVHDLVEEFAKHSMYAVFKYLASSSNLSITTRCANFSDLSQSSSCNYLLYNTCKLSNLYKAGISLVIDTLTVTPIKDNNNLLNTINLHIKLRKLKELDSLLDSNNYCLDSSLDINSKNNLEDKEATIAKDLTREQKKRLKALLNAKMRDSLSARNKRIIKLLAC